MDVFDALILGALQGVTEFLPVSSSGHLVLGEEFLGLKVEALKSFDVFVHVGTLMAIVVYFWKDFIGLVSAFLNFFVGKLKKDDPYGKLILFLIVGTIPAVLLAIFAEDQIDQSFRNPLHVAYAMIIVAVFFLLGEYSHKLKNPKNDVSKWWQALIIGIAQAIALIPGVSRSGSTIVAGLFQGINREKAARFSFLLGIPAMVGAALYTSLKSGIGEVDYSITLVGFFAAFLIGLASVSFLMRFLKRHTLVVFAVYLLILGSITIFL